MTREWFERNLPDASKDGMCSFRFTGGVLVMLGVAVRVDEDAGSKYVPHRSHAPECPSDESERILASEFPIDRSSEALASW